MSAAAIETNEDAVGVLARAQSLVHLVQELLLLDREHIDDTAVSEVAGTAHRLITDTMIFLESKVESA